MKKNNITSNLTFWVLLSIVIGVIVGHFRPDIALYPVFEKKINKQLPISGKDLRQEATTETWDYESDIE
mgnify:CR=1 FL=1